MAHGLRVLLLTPLLLGCMTGGAGDPLLTPCAEDLGEGVRCVRVPVPEDRASPDGRSLDLRVVVVPSPSAQPAAPLVLLPGGPGQAATDLMAIAAQLYGEVLETRDAVFIDQRGSGATNPLHCEMDLADDPSRAFGGLWDPAMVASCFDEAQKRADLQHYTTADYVLDIAAALDALGYEEVVLWGGSGGTRTAAAFMRAFPNRVIGAVLDGVTPLDYAMPLPFARYVQTAWERVVEDCGRQPACAAAFPDLASDLARVSGRFGDGPVGARVRARSGGEHEVAVHDGDFAYALRGVLYNAGATAELPKEIHRAATTGDLSFFAQSLYDRSAALLSGVLAVGLHLSVYCTEDVPRIEVDRVAAETAGTIIGTYLVDQYRGACEVWSVEAVDPDWYRSFESDVPVLFVSGYYDPSTPAASAELVRQSFPNSEHFVVRNAGHGAGFGCARDAVAGFLTAPSLEGLTNPCPDEPIRFTTP